MKWPKSARRSDLVWSGLARNQVTAHPATSTSIRSKRLRNRPPGNCNFFTKQPGSDYHPCGVSHAAHCCARRNPTHTHTHSICIPRWEESEKGHTVLSRREEDDANLPPNFLFDVPPASHDPVLMANRMHALYESWSRATWQLPRIFAFMVRDSAQVLWFIKKNPDSTTPFTDDVDVGDISTPFEPGEGSSATD